MKNGTGWREYMAVDGQCSHGVHRAFIREDAADKTWRACVGDDIAHKVSHANDDGNVNAWRRRGAKQNEGNPR